MSLETKNTSNFERQSAIGKATSNTQAMDENDVTPAKTKKFEQFLEASGERNLQNINLTHGEYSQNGELDTRGKQSNLCLIWDVEEVRSIGLPDHQQKATLFLVSSMLALLWVEEKVTKFRESKAPTVGMIHAIDSSRRLGSIEIACKVFAVPMEMRHVRSLIRFL